VIGARPGATGSDEAAAVRIGDACENDGDSACLLQHRRGRGCVVRKNEREERYAYWLSAAREANRDAAPFFTPKLAAVALAGALTVDQQQSNRIIDPRQKMLELYLGMRRRGELTAKVIDAPPKNLSAARTMSARWGEADSKRKLLGMPGAQSGGSDDAWRRLRHSAFHRTRRSLAFRSAGRPAQKSASIFFALWLSRNTRAGIWPL
jgi:hypothetical protein